jgi:hypothetical protein
MILYKVFFIVLKRGINYYMQINFLVANKE